MKCCGLVSDTVNAMKMNESVQLAGIASGLWAATDETGEVQSKYIANVKNLFSYS